MKLSQVRRHALSLPSGHRGAAICVPVAPRPRQDIHHGASRGGPPVFTADEQRDPVLAAHPDFLEELMWDLFKVVGLRVALAAAEPKVVSRRVTATWQRKAPKALLSRRA
ncbi:MAG: hypothetical protein ABIX46_02510 [Burkholderiaceae bacterium]